MAKYVPSIEKNNQLKSDFIKSFKNLIYKVEKGKKHSHLESDSIKPIVESLKESLSNFEDCLGTGEENVYQLYLESSNSLKNLEKSFNQELASLVENAADELIYDVDSWKDALDGKVEFDDAEFKSGKVRWSKKRLLGRLNELEEIKTSFSENEKRLEEEITLLEKNESEINDSILNEDNERRINELYRKVTTLKSKKSSLDARRSNYSACFDLLDLIYINAKEILTASDCSGLDFGKAKAFLNIGKLKQVLSEPEKAILILHRMDKDILEMSEKTSLIDKKVLSLDKEATSVSPDALAYKEKLMHQKREKESLKELDSNVSIEPKDRSKIKGEK